MGGDGCLGVFIQHALSEPTIQSNLSSILFVPLPYGTGNDISRSLGWNGREGPWAKSLDTMVKALMDAKEDRLAFWNIEMHADV